MDNYNNSQVSKDIFYDNDGLKYTNDTVFRGICETSKIVSTSIGNSVGNIGDGVAALSNVIVYGSDMCCNTRTCKPTWIVVHYTAGGSSKRGAARRTCEFWINKKLKGETTGSADFIVDDEETYQFTKNVDTYYTWNCGDAISRNNPTHPKGGAYKSRVGNRNSIGIELCSTFTSGYGSSNSPNHRGWSYSNAVYRRGIELIRGLMAKYSIPKSNIVRHYDVSGKRCPGIPGWNPEPGSNDETQWYAFLSRI